MRIIGVVVLFDKRILRMDLMGRNLDSACACAMQGMLIDYKIIRMRNFINLFFPQKTKSLSFI